jgi:adenosylhomocysteine nucleosidase
MRVIVTFAVQAEFAPWRRIRNFDCITNTEFMTQIGGSEVRALITGIRARNFQLPAADFCVVSGVAGSLKARHGIGSVLVAEAVKRENREACSTGVLVETAAQCGAIRVESFYTADNVVNTASEKARLGQKSDAVDMESYAILAEANRRGIPAVAIRAISDTADQNLPLDFNRIINEDGELKWLPALSQVAASPASLPRLVRFGFESSRAARKLAAFLDKYLENRVA